MPTFETCPVCDGQGKLIKVTVISRNPYPQLPCAPKYVPDSNDQIVTCTQCGGTGTVAVSADGTVTLFRGL